MPLTYTRAIEPKPGDAVTSRVIRSAARACNDRSKMGPALPWRLIKLLLSMFAQIRNPDASQTQFPTLGEYFEFYQNLRPQDAQWPDAGPGEPEGLNVANQIVNFVVGSDFINVPAEADRLTNPAQGGIDIDDGHGTPLERWELAKRQRGALDPRTGAMGAPALTAASSYAYLRQDASSPVGGFAFGDYLPGPENHGPCADPDEDKTSLDYLFTKLHDPTTTLTFNSCPSVADSIIGVVRTPFLYVLFFWDNRTPVVLPKTEWLEGPYEFSPSLRKTANGMVERALSQFIRDFRGDAGQRNAGWNEFAFQTQEFLTSQYHLAPQRGSEHADNVIPKYPRFALQPPKGILRAGTPLPLTVGGIGNRYQVDKGFVCASAFVLAQGLAGPLAVSVARDGVELGIVTLDPDDEGVGQAILTFFRPEAGGHITLTVAEDAKFVGDTRQLIAEISELWQYKPSLPDAYLVLRCGGAEAADFPVDGGGIDCGFAKTISERYFKDGVVVSIAGHAGLQGTLGPINSNAVFDAARRMSQIVRILPRENFRAIAVEGGKTILWLTRWARGSRTDVPIDLLQGIAPDPNPIPSGKLVWGRRYKVSGAKVIYNGRRYLPDAIFTAEKDVLDYSGLGNVYEADGVYDAPPAGWSNQWLFGLRCAPYNPNEASLWKPDVFSDYWTLFNPCLFGDPAIAADKAVLAHIGYGQALTSPLAVLFPEAPDSFNYVPTPGAVSSTTLHHANYMYCDDGDDACKARRKQFYQSCGMFQPWPELEKVELDGDEVKITFATFDADPDHDTADFGRDHTTWNLTNLRNEPRRTWRNALREYQIYINTGRNSSLKVGDEAWLSQIQTLPDRPYGAIFPKLLFLQQVREPHEDYNDDQDDDDSPLIHDVYAHIDLFIRASGEAFIDDKLTLKLACQNEWVDVYNFTPENLNFAADGGRGSPVLPTQATEFIDEADTRPDQPEFYGPMHNVVVSAETAAAVARRLNLLKSFRVNLPMVLQQRSGSTGDIEIDVSGQVVNARGQGAAATNTWTFGSATYAVYTSGGGGGGAPTIWTDWADYDATIGAGAGALLGVNPHVDPKKAYLLPFSGAIEWRWAGVDDGVSALPPDIAALLVTGPWLAAKITSYDYAPTKGGGAGLDDGTQCHDSSHGVDNVWSNGAGGSVLWGGRFFNSRTTCVAITTGSVSGGPSLGGIVWNSGDANPGSHPDNFCRDGPYHNVSVQVYSTITPTVSVPLKDLPPQPVE